MAEFLWSSGNVREEWRWYHPFPVVIWIVSVQKNHIENKFFGTELRNFLKRGKMYNFLKRRKIKYSGNHCSKVRVSPSKKVGSICFNKNLFKSDENGLLFCLKCSFHS